MRRVASRVKVLHFDTDVYFSMGLKTTSVIGLLSCLQVGAVHGLDRLL
jgi:hypothetical protein